MWESTGGIALQMTLSACSSSLILRSFGSFGEPSYIRDTDVKIPYTRFLRGGWVVTILILWLSSFSDMEDVVQPSVPCWVAIEDPFDALLASNQRLAGSAKRSADMALSASELFVDVKEHIETSSSTTACRSELDYLVAKYSSLTVQEKCLQILEHPGDMLEMENVGEITDFIHKTTASKRRTDMERRTYRIADRDNFAVEEQKTKYKLKMMVKEASLVSTLARFRDQRCTPPVTIMRSLENLRGCVNKTVWERQCAENYVLSRNLTAKIADSLSWWREKPSFVIDSPEESVSTIYSYTVSDNLEFYLPCSYERMKDGTMQKKELLHTVTSECCFT